MLAVPCAIKLPPNRNIWSLIVPLTTARWIVHTAEAVPKATRKSPVMSIRLGLLVLRHSMIQVRIPARMIVMLAETLVTFHKDNVGRRIWIAGRDAATIRLAASEFTSARRIETVFISVPPCPQFMIIELYLKECLPKLRRKTYEYSVNGIGR